MTWPSPLGGKNKLVGWLNRLRLCVVSSEIKQVVGGYLIENTSGKTLVVLESRGGDTGGDPVWLP